jgi:hypothetical protein
VTCNERIRYKAFIISHFLNQSVENSKMEKRFSALHCRLNELMISLREVTRKRNLNHLILIFSLSFALSFCHENREENAREKRTHWNQS